MDGTLKRKAAPGSNNPNIAGSKRQKSQASKKWRVVHKNDGGDKVKTAVLEAGDSGIWATCDKGTEGKCIAELRALFNEYCEKLYKDDSGTTGDPDGEGGDIEAEIANEINSIKKPDSTPLIQPVRIETQCVVFFKTRFPVVPVDLVYRICSDAQQGVLPKRARFIRRLTPSSFTAKSTEKGLEELSNKVLAPHFHARDCEAKKFAIRPTTRHNTTLGRDIVIKQVAHAVGGKHSVDLKNYDLLILIETYKNICGMAVVKGDYEALKRYNISEIWRERKEREQGNELEEEGQTEDNHAKKVEAGGAEE